MISTTYEKLLQSWDVPELIPIFFANKVTQDVFHLLTNDDINRLIPESGIAKIKFTEKLMGYRYRSQCRYPTGDWLRPDDWLRPVKDTRNTNFISLSGSLFLHLLCSVAFISL